MTDTIKALRDALAAFHTPLPWRWWVKVSGARIAGRPADGSKNFVCDVLLPELQASYSDNAELICAAVNAAPTLLAEVDRQAAEISRLRKALEKIADWDANWGPWPENNEAWRAMAVLTAREAVPKEQPK